MRISKRFYRCPHNKPKVDVASSVAWSELVGADHPVSLYFKAEDGSRILVELTQEDAASIGKSLTGAAESIANCCKADGCLAAWQLLDRQIAANRKVQRPASPFLRSGTRLNDLKSKLMEQPTHWNDTPPWNYK